MRKIMAGLLGGIIAGLIDVTPMALMKLPLNANLSAFFTWVAIGFMIATSGLKMNGVLKGLLIAFIMVMPVGILAGVNNPTDIIPIAIMTLILGSGLGYVIDKQ